MEGRKGGPGRGGLLPASIKAWWCSAVRSGSGRSRKNCFSRPVTLLTSWKKFSGFRKSSIGLDESKLVSDRKKPKKNKGEDRDAEA